MSCHALSCHVMPCRVLSSLVLSCLVMSCLVLSCLVVSCRVLSCLVLSCLDCVLVLSVTCLVYIFRLLLSSHDIILHNCSYNMGKAKGRGRGQKKAKPVAKTISTRQSPRRHVAKVNSLANPPANPLSNPPGPRLALVANYTSADEDGDASSDENDQSESSQDDSGLDIIEFPPDAESELIFKDSVSSTPGLRVVRVRDYEMLDNEGTIFDIVFRSGFEMSLVHSEMVLAVEAHNEILESQEYSIVSQVEMALQEISEPAYRADRGFRLVVEPVAKASGLIESGAKASVESSLDEGQLGGKETADSGLNLGVGPPPLKAGVDEGTLHVEQTIDATSGVKITGGKASVEASLDDGQLRPKETANLGLKLSEGTPPVVAEIDVGTLVVEHTKDAISGGEITGAKASVETSLHEGQLGVKDSDDTGLNVGVGIAPEAGGILEVSVCDEVLNPERTYMFVAVNEIV